MSKYRKKPVVVEAWNIGELMDTEWDDLPQVIRDAVDARVINPRSLYLAVHTPECTMDGWREDYLIRGVEGEYYPCKADIFHKTYEEVPHGED